MTRLHSDASNTPLNFTCTKKGVDFEKLKVASEFVGQCITQDKLTSSLADGFTGKLLENFGSYFP